MKPVYPKIALLVFSVLFFLLGDCKVAKCQEVLTNATIIKLSKIGLSDVAIIGKIRRSTDHFNTDVDSMMYLKDHGVSSTVINAMDSITAVDKENIYEMSHINDPTFMHPSGIYWYDPSNTSNPLQKIEANKVAGSSGDSYSIYGFGSSSLIYTLSGESANLQINNASPTFYFYFNPHKTTNESFDASFLTSPNSFTLVSFNVSNSRRYFGAGSSSSVGGTGSSSSGISSKNICLTTFKKISEGIYEVTLQTPQKLGEFAFTATGENHRDMILFDWGIDLH